MNKKIILLSIVLLFITACGKNNEENAVNSINNLEKTNEEIVHEHCTRDAIGKDESEVNLSYEIYSKGDVLIRLESTEQVVTEDQDTLTEYENAYKNIHSYYKNLKYYTTNVLRENNSVTSKIIIEYDKIDIDKLIDIEGEEDNIFENKVPKKSSWKEMAEKFGTKCTTVE